ncbi:MAG TPA: glycosyl hydrolase family 8 [Roseiflexaceae bacterium]|nr:glycosyl hydrolase family 8 [Roseiflexaceae bacterium]
MHPRSNGDSRSPSLRARRQPFRSRLALLGLNLALLAQMAACAQPTDVPPTPTLAPTLAPAPTTVVSPPPEAPVGAIESGVYRNLFRERGNTDAAIQAKLDAAWRQLFYGDDASQRVYYPVGDMAYILDVGNGDVRSEGMSYGMMIAVQLDKQAEFDRLWKWAKTYMYHADGPRKGYFAWHCAPDGQVLDPNSASDGEEWFATALLFAAGRWGTGAGIFNYRAEAQAILDTMLHKGAENNGIVTSMFDPERKQVVFVPQGRNATFTDPSYHLPAFYELWARWADKDTQFWREAADASRAFFKTAAHPQTGLMPDYASFDGAPRGGEHADFRFDAWRAASNVAVDYAWFAKDGWAVEQSNRLLAFFRRQGIGGYANQFTLDGKPLSSDHSPGLVAMNAVATLAATDPTAGEFVDALWDTPIPSGKWRYYDGMLYMLALLHVSGNFRAYPPA